MHLRRSIALVSAAAATIATLVSAAAASSLASYDLPPVAGAWSLAPGEYYAELSGSSFQTAEAFDAGGRRVGLPEFTGQRAFRTYVELGWKKSMSLQLALPFVTTTDHLSGGEAQSQTGLEDLSVGLRVSLLSGPRAAALQLRWETPAGYNRRLVPSVGDGLQKISTTLQVGGPLGKPAFWQLGGGVRIQYKSPTDVSDLLTKEPTSWKWPEHMTANGALGIWFGRVQAAGLFSVDASSFLPDDKNHRVNSFAVGSRFTYRMDERLDAFAGSWNTPSGRNALSVDQYYAGIAWKSTKLNRLQGFLGGESRP